MTLTPAHLVTITRLAAIPILYVLALTSQHLPFAILFILCSLLDAVDGWVARRYRQASDWGRRFDSVADAAFYNSIPIWFWWVHPEVVRQWFPWVIVPFLVWAAGVVVKIQNGRFIAALHLPSTRAAGVVTFAYLVWALWGKPPIYATQTVMAILTVAATVELETVLSMGAGAARGIPADGNEPEGKLLGRDV
jgi:phosphatidylglycerophosphate synthase